MALGATTFGAGAAAGAGGGAGVAGMVKLVGP